jgi:hypothetical protein
MYPDLNSIFLSGLVLSNTLLIRVPIRKTHFLNENPVFPFHHILTDSEFLKPLNAGSFSDVQEICSKSEKGSDLLYIARYTASKGQIEFLETVDPKQLRGHTVHFYGSNIGVEEEFLHTMKEIAAARGIRISIHPPVLREELFPHYCKAAGMIHYAVADNVSGFQYPTSDA